MTLSWSLILSWIIFICILLVFLSQGGNIQGVTDGASFPWFYPPGWVFGLVWTTLFTLFFIVLAEASDTQRIVGLLYFTLTLAWTPLFVYTKRFDLSFFYLLFILLCTFAFAFYTQSWYFFPQVVWITLATVLALSLYILNGSSIK